jgi:glycosyltransferase involved in cell wall biosynthesis
MHIAFLTPEYPHPLVKRSAGIGSSIQNLAGELVKMGHNVSIFIYGATAQHIERQQNITLYFIPHKKFAFLGWYRYRKRVETYINKVIVAQGIQVIEAVDWTGFTAFMHFKCKLVIRLHGSDTYFCYLEQRKQKWKNKWFETKALKQADALVSVSQFTADITAQLFKIKKPIKVLYNGIDTKRFLPQETAPQQGELLYFGSLIRKKGVLELAHIFNQIVALYPTAHLTLLGADVVDIVEHKSTWQLFQQTLNKEALASVTHISQVPYNEVQHYLQQAAVVVLPSFAEAFPMTWLEAMAMGKAMVTSNIGWANELMVNGVTGFTVHPKEHSKYATKVVTLLHDKEMAATMGDKARLRIEQHFTNEKCALQNATFYKSLLNE